VDTNYGSHGVESATLYNHFSLLKSIEGSLGLPCLNHACDSGVQVMSDLFSNIYPSPSSGSGTMSQPAATHHTAAAVH